MVHVVGVPGHQDRGALSDIGRGGLQEQQGFCESREVELVCVVWIISANANNLPAPLPKARYVPCCHREET